MNTHPPLMEEETKLREQGEKGSQLCAMAIYGTALIAMASLMAGLQEVAPIA